MNNEKTVYTVTAEEASVLGITVNTEVLTAEELAALFDDKEDDEHVDVGQTNRRTESLSE